MIENTREADPYQCTAAGRVIAKGHLDERFAERQSVERAAILRLKQGDHAGALQLLGKYEASQPVPRGSGVHWAESGGDAVSRDRLRNIFNRTPTVLESADPETLEELRVAAAMRWMWGTEEASPWLPQKLEIRSRLDPGAMCRALRFHAEYLVSLERDRSLGLLHVRIRHINDDQSCLACAAISGRTFPIDDAPELPFPGCTCPPGGRCSVVSA